MKKMINDKIVSDYLITLIASVLKSTSSPSIPSSLDIKQLYKLACLHSVANLAYYGLIKLDPLPPSNIIKLFQNSCYAAVLQEALQQAETEKILSALEENQIKYMPLKGYIIKHCYPNPDMRTMGDVDILIEESQLGRVGDIMLDLGYDAISTGGNHDVYYKKPVIVIELHRALVSDTHTNLYAYLGSGWNRAILKGGYHYQYEMSKEDFYIYMLAHTAKHYQSGGIGVRSVMDVWVYNQQFSIQMDWDYIYTELRKFGLLGFGQIMVTISEQWFGEKHNKEYYPEISSFILSSGTHGTEINQLIQNKKDTDSLTTFKLSYTFKHLFPNKQIMVAFFPFLQNMPFLLPLCWILRGFKTLFFSRYKIKKIFNNLFAMSKSKAMQMKKIKKQSGLNNKL